MAFFHIYLQYSPFVRRYFQVFYSNLIINLLFSRLFDRTKFCFCLVCYSLIIIYWLNSLLNTLKS